MTYRHPAPVPPELVVHEQAGWDEFPVYDYRDGFAKVGTSAYGDARDGRSLSEDSHVPPGNTSTTKAIDGHDRAKLGG